MNIWAFGLAGPPQQPTIIDSNVDPTRNHLYQAENTYQKCDGTKFRLSTKHLYLFLLVGDIRIMTDILILCNLLLDSCNLLLKFMLSTVPISTHLPQLQVVQKARQDKNTQSFHNR